MLDLETPHGHAVHGVDARGQLVPPRDVVRGAGGQDFHVGVAREMFGDVSSVKLGAAVDGGAVALNDDRELHCASSVRSRRDPKSAADGSPRRRWFVPARLDRVVGGRLPTRLLCGRRSVGQRHRPHDVGRRRAAAAAAPPAPAPAALTWSLGAGWLTARRRRLLARTASGASGSGRGRNSAGGRGSGRCLEIAADRRRLLDAGVGRRLRRLVDHGAFEHARPAFVELETAGQRFDPHLEVLHLDAHASWLRARGCA